LTAVRLDNEDMQFLQVGVIALIAMPEEEDVGFLRAQAESA